MSLIYEGIDISIYPKYLQTSIIEWEENKDDSLHWDMYWDDLYGSINSAQWDNEITIPEAKELRRVFLGLEQE